MRFFRMVKLLQCIQHFLLTGKLLNFNIYLQGMFQAKNRNVFVYIYMYTVFIPTGTCGHDTASPIFTPHPPPLFYHFFPLHFHGLEICKTAIICRFLTYQSTYAKKGGCCVLSTSTCVYTEREFIQDGDTLKYI